MAAVKSMAAVEYDSLGQVIPRPASRAHGKVGGWDVSSSSVSGVARSVLPKGMILL